MIKPLTRNGYPVFTAFLLVAASGGISTTPASAQNAARPNIVYILADDLGYGEVGCYGQQRIKTPNLDKMAAEGTRYTQFYAGSAVCAPSRASLLTGQHTGHTLVRGNGGSKIAPEPVTLGTLMKNAGYHTGCIGKWGIGGIGTTGSPQAHGFDEFAGFVGQVEAHEQYPDHMTRGTARWDVAKGTYANDAFTSEALDFVQRNKANPFFLYLPVTTPHAKMEVPSQGIYAGESWPDNEKNKAAMITRMDTAIGSLFAELKELGLDENTLVFFTSDNGPTKEGTDPNFFDSNGPLRGIKRDLYEGGIREPMIARWPSHVKAGVVSDQVWAAWEILPTFLDIAGVSDIPKRDGIDMKAALLEGTPVEHPPLYWEFYENGFAQAIRKGDWKLVKTTTAALELYDLKTDLGETNSLSAKRPEVIMELMPLLTSMRVDSPNFSVAESAKPKVKKWQQKQNGGKNKQAGKGKKPANIAPAKL